MAKITGYTSGGVPLYDAGNGTSTNDPSKAITPDQFNSETPLQTITPPPEDTTGLLGTTQGVADYFNQISTEQKAQEAEMKKGQTDITSLMSSLTGKEADTQQAMKDTGATAVSEQLTRINAEAQALYKEAQAIPIQVQEANKNTGATDRGVAPQSAGALRMNALKALSLSQQYSIAQGQYENAKTSADRIVQLKYAPLEQNLKILQTQYTMNLDMLNRIDKKRTEALGIALQAKADDLKARKDAEQEMYDRKIKEQEIARDQFNADRQFAQAKLQADRQFEQNQKEFGADYALKVRAANLAEAKYKNDLVQQDIKNRQQAIEGVDTTDTTKFTDKIKQIEEISKSSGLAGAVGPNRLARDFGLGSLTGEKQAFIGNVQNLISADVLQTLVNLKKSGGTLGAVSEKELSLLQAASSRIGEWAKTDDQGKVLYYDVSEKEFKKELDRIKESTQRVVTAIEEQAFIEYLKIQQ